MDYVSDVLMKEFSEVVARGNEEDARKFLVDNLKKFPEDVQEKIVGAFFEEALSKKAEGLHTVADFQKEGLDAINDLEQGKRQLQDKQKLLDLKESIK
jgi:hypothetical protein